MVWNYISQRRQIIRTLGSGIGKTAVIYPAAFLVATAGGTLMLGIVFYAKDVFGASAGQIGWLNATWSLCYIIGCLLLRPLSIRMLPRYSMLTATFLMFVTIAALTNAKAFFLVFVFYGLFGFTLSFFWPPMVGWLSANIEGVELSRSMGRFNLCWSAGMVASPVLAGWLSEIDPRLPLRFSSALYVATTLLMLGAVMALSGLGHDDRAHAEERAAGKGKGDGTPLRFPAWLGMFAAFLVGGAIMTVLPISGQHDLHLSKRAVGGLFLARSLMYALCFIVAGRTKFWHFRSRPMVAATLCLCLSVAAMAVARSVLTVGLLLALIGILSAQSYTSALFHGVSGAVQRSRRMAIHEALLSAGLICGSASGGMIYQGCGMKAVYLFCSGMLLAVTVVQIVLSMGIKKGWRH